MPGNLFVGNLVWEASADDLYFLFLPFGPVLHAQVVIDRVDGRSKGYGFVEMSNEVDANGVIEALHDQDYRGRKLIVTHAEPHSER